MLCFPLLSICACMAFLVGSFTGTSWGAGGGREDKFQEGYWNHFETLKNPEGKEFITTKLKKNARRTRNDMKMKLSDTVLQT